MVDTVVAAVISLTREPGSDDVTTPMPLYLQFAEHVRDEIRAGRLKPGQRLPSTTEFVATGRWARSTVVAGMRQLRQTGWVRGQPGQAVFVADERPVE